MKRQLVLLLLTQFIALAASHAQWQAKVIQKFPAFGKGGEPVKVRFCPVDPSKVLAHVGQRECVIDVVKGTVNHFTKTGELVDWIGDQILMKAGGKYALVRNDSLKSSGQPNAAANEAITRVLDLPMLVGRGKKARIVRQSDGKTLMKPPFRKGIYGFQSNGDHSRWILYLGEADYVHVDARTKKKTPLPQRPDPNSPNGFSAWKFTADGSVIAEMGLPPAGVHPESEEAETIGRTKLFRYDLATRLLEGIALPPELQNKALEVLDSGLHGHLFVAVSQQGTRVKNLGAYVLKLARPGA